MRVRKKSVQACSGSRRGSSSWNKRVNPTSASSPVGGRVFSLERSCCFTWMRHLLTSLAQRALLQPEVRDSPERRKRRAAAAGRIISPGLILTAHQHGTGNTYINRTHRAGPQRTNKQNFIADIPTEGEKSCSWCIHRESEIRKKKFWKCETAGRVPHTDFVWPNSGLVCKNISLAVLMDWSSSST